MLVFTSQEVAKFGPPGKIYRTIRDQVVLFDPLYLSKNEWRYNMPPGFSDLGESSSSGFSYGVNIPAGKCFMLLSTRREKFDILCGEHTFSLWWPTQDGCATLFESWLEEVTPDNA